MELPSPNTSRKNKNGGFGLSSQNIVRIMGCKATKIIIVGGILFIGLLVFNSSNGALTNLTSTGSDSWSHGTGQDPTLVHGDPVYDPYPNDRHTPEGLVHDVPTPETFPADGAPSHERPTHDGPTHHGSVQHSSDHDAHLPPPNPANPDSSGRASESIEHNPNLPNPPPIRAPSHERFLTIATMFRNERRWLREWIEFYLMMGVDHFLLYDNYSNDLPLDVLQYYVDRGQVTYIPWPPEAVPPPTTFHTWLEEWQYSWFKDTLETCLYESWIIHKHAPCQMAAFADAVRRTKGGVSRWLGILDVDEFLFPRPTSRIRSLAELLRYDNDTDHLKIYGGTFGTSGHIDHAARRRPGDPLQALIIEEYTYRAAYDQQSEHPGNDVTGDWHAHGHGQLGEMDFRDGWNGDVSKSFADPDFVSHSAVHEFNPADMSHWNEKVKWTGDPVWKYNHYTMLSMADVRRKAEVNGNPLLDSFTAEMNEFFSRERDTDILDYVPELKRRMRQAQSEHLPPRPDDWEPTT